MPVQYAELLLKVWALHDVLSHEKMACPEASECFEAIVEEAARKIAEDCLAGIRHDGPTHVDYKGSRVHFETRERGRVARLLIYRFDYDERTDLVCTELPVIVHGERELIAQYAVVSDGKRTELDRLPECDLREPSRARPHRRPQPASPTMHRALAAIAGVAVGLWSTTKSIFARLAAAAGGWLAVARQRQAIAGLARLAGLATLIGIRPKPVDLLALWHSIVARGMALACCSPEKCSGSARRQHRNRGMTSPGGLLSFAGRFAAALRIWPTGGERGTTWEAPDRKTGIIIEIRLADPVGETDLGRLHGLRGPAIDRDGAPPADAGYWLWAASLPAPMPTMPRACANDSPAPEDAHRAA